MQKILRFQRKPGERSASLVLAATLALLVCACGAAVPADDVPMPAPRACAADAAVTSDRSEGDGLRIRPYAGNPCYWEYAGRPLLLLGGSDQDNLFNHPDIWPFGLESHLDLMVRYGGNYVRNTMSSRDPGNAWPFGKDDEGFYDLDTWSDEYWQRFETFLQLTYDKDIVVQIEVWDRFDFSRDPWDANPFNPKNNRTYDLEASGLPESIDSHPAELENPFFRTLDSLEDNPLVRHYQELLVDRILSFSLRFPHVLYTVSNETNDSPEWSEYWAYRIRERAADEGVEVHVTEMWDAWNLSSSMHRETFDRPDLYSFVDISQNNHQSGQIHWDNAQHALAGLDDPPRPVNSVKIYGGESHGGSLEEGTRRFWRNIFGGLASSRFHRSSHPIRPSGAGLSRLAQVHMRSMRMLTDSIDVFRMTPRLDLLSDRGPDEAYAMAEVGSQYAVYFPDGGEVVLDISGVETPMNARWLDILTGMWGSSETVESMASVVLAPPGEGPWAVILFPSETGGE